MDEETLLWINYVKSNINCLKQAVKQSEGNLLQIRQFMSEMGVELTPEELSDFTKLLENTINYIVSEDL